MASPLIKCALPGARRRQVVVPLLLGAAVFERRELTR
jgi:hypothetical protein